MQVHLPLLTTPPMHGPPCSASPSLPRPLRVGEWGQEGRGRREGYERDGEERGGEEGTGGGIRGKIQGIGDKGREQRIGDKGREQGIGEGKVG